nr:hypothetical protein [Candidatus Enterousia merdequi]
MKKSIFCLLSAAVLLAGCNSGTRDFYEVENPSAVNYDETSANLMTEKNEFAQIDSYKPMSMAERESIANKWNTARKETRWQEYKGTMVRVEILLGDTDVREMRLRLMQNADGMDVDADSRTVLARVADYEMKKVCGRNAESIVIVYDTPSSEVMRPTSFFDYRIESEGNTMREYGFRCVYNK